HTHSKTVTRGITPTNNTSTVSSLKPQSAIQLQPEPALMTAIPPTYYIQHAPISINAAKLNTRSFEKILELNCGKNNWSDWSFAMKLVLNQHLIGGYLVSTISKRSQRVSSLSGQQRWYSTSLFPIPPLSLAIPLVLHELEPLALSFLSSTHTLGYIPFPFFSTYSPLNP
ncbi:hypothetical protein PAXRUDRAFT_151351, partial [Paxillus rubicundulus Ve08.2h10]